MGYAAGTRVKHTIFGVGTVTAYKPDLRHRTYCQDCGAKIQPIENGGSIVIKFDDHGAKELQLSFAAGKLRRIAKKEK